MCCRLLISVISDEGVIRGGEGMYLEGIEVCAELDDGRSVLTTALLHLQQLGRLDHRLELVH